MIYLDNAATTFPKPERVYAEADKFTRTLCGNPGRSSHRLSSASAKEIYICREEIAELFGAEPENVVFTMNATYALNIAINALHKPGSEILISNIEHNAVIRPVYALRSCTVRTFDVSGSEENAIKSFVSKITPNTSLVICNHVSNICGITVPVEKIGAICRQRGINYIIDASQSAGIIPLDIQRCHADVICAPGHKGLYGLQGSGFAVFSRELSEKIGDMEPLVSGGNGVNSPDPSMPDFLPERFEAGTLPTPSIVGLRYGIAEIKRIGINTVREKEEYLCRQLKNGLLNIDGVTVFASRCGGSTALFNVGDIPSSQVGEMLDECGICVRSGFHCSPLAHRLLKTGENGAVRASFSIFNSKRDVEKMLIAVNGIAKRTKIRN